MNTELCEFCTFEENGVIVGLTDQVVNVVALRQLVDEVLSSLRAGTIHHDDPVVNDISTEHIVSANRSQLRAMISRLMTIVVDNSEHNVIHVSAKTIGKVTLMHIRNSHAEFTSAIAQLLRGTEPLAESLGGCVTVSSNRMYGLCLVFTFLNH